MEKANAIGSSFVAPKNVLTRGVLQPSAPDFLEFFRTAR